MPIFLKDNIATGDKMQTTAGSLALVGAKPTEDAFLVKLLRKAGALIFGKTNLSEWAAIRGTNQLNGWSARGGFSRNPYEYHLDPCGSSTGSATAVAASLGMAAIGTETDGSILCPAGFNSVVGIKPTVGLVSRTGVITISRTMETPGTLARTMRDAVLLLDSIVGFDGADPATRRCLKSKPPHNYSEFLNPDGLRGKRIGVSKGFFFVPEAQYLGGSTFTTPAGEKVVIFLANYSGPNPQTIVDTCLAHLRLMQRMGATIVEVGDVPYVVNSTGFEANGELGVLLPEVRYGIERYLRGLARSPVRTLGDIIAFNKANAAQELDQANQDYFIQASNLSLTDRSYLRARMHDLFITRNGIDAVFDKFNLDLFAGPTNSPISSLAALEGYPALSIPAGFTADLMPFGMTFLARPCNEKALIEGGSGFEHATHVRKRPTYANFDPLPL
eukprot:SM000183S03991  [mRNA]  locus=s183:92302:94314:- [translate_table: standard]